MPLRRKEHPPVTHDNLVPPYRLYAYFEDAAANPFRPAARGFELVNAWWLAEAATLVYHLPGKVGEEFARAGFDVFEAVSAAGTDTECFVAANDEFVVVAFRGTESGPRQGEVDFRHIFIDVLTDAKFRLVPFGAGQAHEGFLAAYLSVEAGLRQVLTSLDDGRRTFWFTGHSLGAALATVAASRAERLHGLYTFGSPRVGDVAFAEGLRATLAGRFGVEHYRFVHDNDIVTTVPPHGLYRHSGALKHIFAGGQISDDPTLLARLSDTVADLGDKVRVLLRVPAAHLGRLEARLLDLTLEGLLDHVPTLYATHVWNAYAGGQGG